MLKIVFIISAVIEANRFQNCLREACAFLCAIIQTVSLYQFPFSLSHAIAILI